MGDQQIDGRTVLKWNLQILGGKLWAGFIWNKTSSVMGPCEHGNEPLVSTKKE